MRLDHGVVLATLMADARGDGGSMKPHAKRGKWVCSPADGILEKPHVRTLFSLQLP